MAVEAGASMVQRPSVTPTAEIEIERSVVTANQVDQFLRAANPVHQSGSPSPSTAPLSFALAMRRSQGPHVAIAPQAFAIHGGHDLQLQHPIRIGGEYSVLGRVAEIFEKSGRSGPMTVVVRRIRIVAPDGTEAVTLRDRQIVRWRPTAATNPPPTVQLNRTAEAQRKANSDRGHQSPSIRSSTSAPSSVLSTAAVPAPTTFLRGPALCATAKCCSTTRPDRTSSATPAWSSRARCSRHSSTTCCGRCYPIGHSPGCR